MYSVVPKVVLGFHGCDKSIGEKVIAGKENIKHGQNDYDWLGSGAYFWENDPERALNFASQLKNNPRKGKPTIKEPFVIGAVIDLGNCLNLLNFKSLKILKQNYLTLKKFFNDAQVSLSQNIQASGNNDLLIRYLDRLVIETTHKFNKSKPYDTVRGVFFEGKELYPNAGFKEKNHIQICVRNPNCIKGFFKVRQSDLSYSIP